MNRVSPTNIEMLRPMTKDTLTQRVANAIKAYIVSENLSPGAKLPSERNLSELLAVSRNIVREGLSVLVAEGVIVKKPGKGIFLREMAETSVAHVGAEILQQERARYEAIREARAAVEIGAIGLIVARVTKEDLDQLEQAVLKLERKASAGETFFREDMQFHLTLLQSARNEFLLQWSPMVEEVMRVWMYQEASLTSAIKPRMSREDGARVAAEHRAILEAVRRGDAEASRTLLKKHFLVPDL